MPIELVTVEEFDKEIKDDSPELTAVKKALAIVHQAKTVKGRFDALEELIEACRQVKQVKGDDPAFNKIDELMRMSTQLSVSLLDADEENDLLKKNAHDIEGAIKLALENVYNAETHQARFDALGALIEECSHVGTTEPNYDTAQNIRKLAVEFASNIVDAENEADLLNKIADRNKFKEMVPDYMPWDIELPRVEDWLGEDVEVNDAVLANDPIAKAISNVYEAKTIYDRFDALAELIDKCNHMAKSDATYSKAQELRKTATKIAIAIVDAVDENDLVKKIAARNQYKTIDPEYMPWHEAPTRTPVKEAKDRKGFIKESMRKMARNIHEQRYNWVNPQDAVDDVKDKEHPVTYLTEMKDRERFRIFPSGGKLKTFRVSPYTMRLAISPFSTKNYEAHSNPNQAIFVVSPKGDIFANVTVNYEFYHSSFLAAGATFFAGTITVVDGTLKFFDAWSGHYKPGSNKVIQMLAFLHKANLLKDKALMGTFSVADAVKKIAGSSASLPKIDMKRLQDSVVADIDYRFFFDGTKKAIAKKYVMVPEAKNTPELLLTRLFEFRSFDAFIERLSKKATETSTYSALTLDKIDFMIRKAYEYVDATNKLDYFDNELIKAVKADNKEMVAILLDSGLKVGARSSSTLDSGGMALYSAVETGRLEIAEMLLKHHAFPSFFHPENKDTPLLCAIRHGNIPMAKLLIKHTADIRQSDEAGHSPLFDAILKKLSTVVKDLLKAKTINLSEKPYLSLAIYTGGSAEMVNALIQAGANIDQPYQGFTPLMYAVQAGNANLAKLLIENGAHVDALGPNGLTALHIAADTGHRNIVQLLIDANADPTIKANTLDQALETPKETAKKAGHENIYQLLSNYEKQPSVTIQKLFNEILALEIKSKGLLKDVQESALYKLNILVAETTPPETLAGFLAVYKELELLSKNFITFSPLIFSDKVKVPASISKAIFDAYEKFNNATDVKTAEKSLNELVQVIKDCREKAAGVATQKPLAKLIDESLEAAQKIAKPPRH